MHVFLRFTWNTQQEVRLLHKPGVKTALKTQNWQEKMSPCKVIHSCMLCHYKLAGPLLFLLFLRACICVNSSTMAGVCEVNGVLLRCTGLQRRYWYWCFCLLIWKKTKQVENFNSMILTAVSWKFYWKNVDVGSP